jgi:hypothetical protein
MGANLKRMHHEKIKAVGGFQEKMELPCGGFVVLAWYLLIILLITGN